MDFGMGVGNTIGNWWDVQHPMDKLALATAPIPILGDVTGLAADARMFTQEPESRTPLNFGLSALGALPFVPAVSAITKGADKAPDMSKQARMDAGKPEGFSRHGGSGLSGVNTVAELRAEANANRGLLSRDIVDTAYRGAHQAPTAGGANSLDSLSDIYPDDIYSDKGLQYYGAGLAGEPESLDIMRQVVGKPNSEVTIYRAVPKGVKEINAGDWVALSKDYAKSHGGDWVDGGQFDIISKKVKAKTLNTDGDALTEWGYNPIPDEGLLGIKPEKGPDSFSGNGLLGRSDDADTFDYPPAENAGKTQIAGTKPTYEKAAKILDESAPKGKSIDYGAGLGVGAGAIKYDTFEPFPKAGFKPNFTSPEKIPSDTYSRLTNLNVLNVVPKEARDSIVKDIGRVLKPKGQAIITTRGADVMNAKGKAGPEPTSIITTIGTYQKGFKRGELVEYLKETLGNGFDVEPLGLGPAGAKITKKGN